MSESKQLWEMLNECNGTNATKEQCLKVLGETEGKSQFEANKILNAFIGEYKRVSV